MSIFCVDHRATVNDGKTVARTRSELDGLDDGGTLAGCAELTIVISAGQRS